jgi:hypothetical protein
VLCVGQGERCVVSGSSFMLAEPAHPGSRAVRPRRRAPGRASSKSDLQCCRTTNIRPPRRQHVARTSLDCTSCTEPIKVAVSCVVRCCVCFDMVHRLKGVNNKWGASACWTPTPQSNIMDVHAQLQFAQCHHRHYVGAADNGLYYDQVCHNTLFISHIVAIEYLPGPCSPADL